jgi:hypothetical protein
MSRVSKAARFLNQVLGAMEVYLVIKVDDVASHDISILELSRKLPRFCGCIPATYYLLDQKMNL